jgi:hypothetical protein
VLSPAQLVFDFFAAKEEGVRFTKEQVALELRSYPKSHLYGALTNLRILGRLSLKSGVYTLVEGSKRPTAEKYSIDYHDTSNRGYEAREYRRNSNLFKDRS